MTREVQIPELGDAGEVEVIELCVSPGDTVAEGDSLIVIESDKASMDVPAPFAGVVSALSVGVGDIVSEGQVIVSFDGEDSDSSETQAASTAVPEEARSKDNESSDESATEQKDDAQSADSDTDSGAEKPATGASVEQQVKVPDIGDASDVVVIEIAVSVGDQISANDILVVVESDKASMEIPSPFDGVVKSLEVKEGDEVSEGSLIAVVEAADSDAPAGDDQTSRQDKPKEKEKGKEKPKEEATSDGKPKSGKAAAGSQPGSGGTQPAGDSAGSSVYAGPAVRRLARELGVELGAVTATGARGRITKDDVKGFVKQRLTSGGGGASSGAGIPLIPEVDFSRFGEIDTQPMSRLRVRGAENLHRSWLNVVHVTQHDEADFTDTDAFRKSLKPEAERRGSKITPLAFIIKACIASLQEFPNFNASLTGDVKSLVLKRYYNIGMAVDTPNGLVVPVIKDADKKGIWELCDDILELSSKARDGKLSIDDLSGGSFSISSLGPIGGTGFTPIVNAPEVAILGVSRLTKKPVWDGSEFVPRDMLPLSLSYDHRAINGAEAGRFVTHLCSSLADMRRALL